MLTDARRSPVPGNGGKSLAAEFVTDQIENAAVATRIERGYIVAVISGTLDSTRAPAIREQFLRVLRPATNRLVIDLSLVSHVDSGGMALLVGTGRRARLLGGSLRLAAATPAVAMALGTAGLDRLLDIFPTVQSAISSPALARRGTKSHGTKVIDGQFEVLAGGQAVPAARC